MPASAGRAKDLIIARRQKPYPHDTEKAIERQLERQGRIAAFPVGCEAGEGIAMEASRRTCKTVAVEAIAARVSEVVGDAVHEPLRPANRPGASSSPGASYGAGRTLPVLASASRLGQLLQ